MKPFHQEIATLEKPELEALQSFFRRLQHSFPGQIRQVFLFGSKARGERDANSDVDVLIITNQDDRSLRREIIDIASDLSLEYDILLSPRVLAKELRRNMTGAEKILWQRLRANRLGGFHFRRQQIIAGFIVDFYCHAASLAVEVDGLIHDRQVSYDQERDRVLADLGVRVLRIPNAEIERDLESVLVTILRTCQSSG